MCSAPHGSVTQFVTQYGTRHEIICAHMQAVGDDVAGADEGALRASGQHPEQPRHLGPARHFPHRQLGPRPCHHGGSPALLHPSNCSSAKSVKGAPLHALICNTAALIGKDCFYFLYYGARVKVLLMVYYWRRDLHSLTLIFNT